MATARRLPSSYNTSTYGDATRDYTSLSAWESDTDTDLVTATAGEVLDVYNDSEYTDDVVLEGATTSSDYFRVIRAVSGSEHKGDKRRGITIGTSTEDYVFALREQYSSLYDLKILLGASILYGGVYARQDNGYNILAGLFIFQEDEYPNIGINIDPFSCDGDIYVINCVIAGFTYSTGGYGIYYDGTNGDDQKAIVYNTVIADCRYGMYAENDSGCLAKNVVVEARSQATNYNWTGNWTQTTCTDDDGVNFELFQPVADSEFDDELYPLAHHADTVANGQGTDLSADAEFAFDDDVRLNTISTWSIGPGVAPSPTTTSGTSRRLPVSYNTSTYGDGTRDYTSLSAWESDTDTDLGDAESGEVLEVYDDSATYDDIIFLSDAISTADYFRVVQAVGNSAHLGYVDAGICFESIIDISGRSVFALGEPYSCAYDLRLRIANDASSVDDAYGFRFVSGRCIAANMIVEEGASEDDSACFAFLGGSITADNFAINCLAYGATGTGGMGFYISDLDISYLPYKVYAYNCISVDNEYGFYKDAYYTEHVLKNCIAQDNTTNYDTGDWSVTTCADDGTVEFKDAANDVYRLDSTDTTAIDQGTDLSSDTMFAFNDDVAKLERAGTWDIGFWEWTVDNIVVAGHFLDLDALSSDSRIDISASSFSETTTFAAETFGPGFMVEAGYFVGNETITTDTYLSVNVSSFSETGTLTGAGSWPIFFSMATPFSESESLSISGVTTFNADDFVQGFISFKCILTGAEDGLADIELPFISFQSRLRSGAPSYLSVTVPGLSDYADEISNRSNGRIIAQVGLTKNNEQFLMENIADVDLETIDVYEGGEARSYVLIGHKTRTTPQPKTVNIADISYKKSSGSTITVRTSVPQFFVSPGDTVVEQYAEESFTAGLISHFMSNGRIITEITSEAA